MGEALLSRWNTIFLMKAMYQKGFSPSKNGKIGGRDNADLEGKSDWNLLKL